MKICSSCKEDKDESFFGKDKRLRDGLRSQCKECHYKVTRAWREKNSERVKQTTKKHYENNREDYLEKARVQWQNTDSETRKKRAEYHKEYYSENKEKYLKNQKDKRRLRTKDEIAKDYLRSQEYYENNKEKIQSRARERYYKLTLEQKKQNVANIKEWRKRNGEKTKAWSAVGNALFKGEIEKPPYCELCGSFDMKIHAHHDDYSKPLDVLWLCHDCHMSLHANQRKQENMKESQGDKKCR